MIISTSYVKPFKEAAVSSVKTDFFSFGITRMSSPDNNGACVVHIDVRINHGIDLVAEALRIHKEKSPGSEGYGAYLAVAGIMVSQMTVEQKTLFEAELAKASQPLHA